MQNFDKFIYEDKKDTVVLNLDRLISLTFNCVLPDFKQIRHEFCRFYQQISELLVPFESFEDKFHDGI